MPNDQMNNTIQPGKKRNHQGQLNPHYQHPHSDSAKAAISSKLKARYETIRQVIDQNPITEDRIKEIVRETVADYIKNNATPVNNNRPIDIRL